MGLTFLTSVVSNEETSTITAVQLLWVNLIQDTMAALALATDPPNLGLLNRSPEPRSASMISFKMWKMIFGQSILQLAVTLFLSFRGTIFTNWTRDEINTVVFNTFVWLQFFNEINCRRVDDKLNVFYGFQRNPILIIILLITIAAQLFIIFFGGVAFSVTRLDGRQWLLSVLLGSLTIPWGAIVRLIPDEFLKGLVPRWLPLQRQRSISLDAELPNEWSTAVEGIRDDLLFIKRLRNKQRLGNIGIRNGPAQTSTSTESTPTEPHPRPSFLRRRTFRSPSNPLQSGLYSIFGADTILPALIATSITLPPLSPSNTSSATPEADDLEAIRGVEVYGERLPDILVSHGADGGVSLNYGETAGGDGQSQTLNHSVGTSGRSHNLLMPTVSSRSLLD